MVLASCGKKKKLLIRMDDNNASSWSQPGKNAYSNNNNQSGRDNNTRFASPNQPFLALPPNPQQVFQPMPPKLPPRLPPQQPKQPVNTWGQQQITPPMPAPMYEPQPQTQPQQFNMWTSSQPQPTQPPLDSMWQTPPAPQTQQLITPYQQQSKPQPIQQPLGSMWQTPPASQAQQLTEQVQIPQTEKQTQALKPNENCATGETVKAPDESEMWQPFAVTGLANKNVLREQNQKSTRKFYDKFRPKSKGKKSRRSH